MWTLPLDFAFYSGRAKIADESGEPEIGTLSCVIVEETRGHKCCRVKELSRMDIQSYIGRSRRL